MLESRDTQYSSDRKDLRPPFYTFAAHATLGKRTSQEGAPGSGSNAGRSQFARTEGLVWSYPRANPKDVERTYLELKRNGVEFSEELTTTDWGKYALFSDPDGNEFEIS